MTIPASSPLSVLSYRLAQSEDLPLLLQYRKECGWGEEKLRKGWIDPDRVFCIFTLDQDGSGTTVDIGMATWVLEMKDDLETACKSTGTVHLGK
jgi:hypothetical protein